MRDCLESQKRAYILKFRLLNLVEVIKDYGDL